MNFRIGDIAGTPSTLMLPFALAFFLVLSYPRLYPPLAQTKTGAALGLAAAVLGGGLGAWIHSWLAAPSASWSWLELRFGSLGGFWGVLIAIALYARLSRQPAFPWADALVPGILVGASVARVGCLFTGCCRGIYVESGFWAGLQPFRPWPLYDIAALLATLGILVIAQRKHNVPGTAVAVFLIAYSPLRFLIEFVRDLDAPSAFLTSGQIMALVQVACGSIVLVQIWRAKSSLHSQ